MPTYLDTAFKDKDKVKALGARFDGQLKKWYVPNGIGLGPFAAWLPSTPGEAVPEINADSSSASSTQLSVQLESTSELARVVPKGVPLSRLLAGVKQAVAAAYQAGVWTIVEVTTVDLRRNGHVYFELAERDAGGKEVAHVKGMMWANTANVVLREFERATSAVLGPGIKLLVRAKPTFHEVYGLSLVIDAIDPDYTLGDLEARKKEIRARLQREGVFDRNKQLQRPWDYQQVLVLAPQSAAGLGDFRAESDRLERLAICGFTYLAARFQGEGAPAEMLTALATGLERWQATRSGLPDALVIIRGGGPANDLAWLNDYRLARWICECPVPVLTASGMSATAPCWTRCAISALTPRPRSSMASRRSSSNGWPRRRRASSRFSGKPIERRRRCSAS